MKNNLIKKAGVFLSVAGLSALVLSSSGCTTTDHAIIGGFVGAGTGAIIGNQSHRAWEGTGIGAAAGAIGGLFLGDEVENAVNRDKYCPIGGEVYSGDVSYCPRHGIQLRYRTP